jgi:hypothetical protein
LPHSFADIRHDIRRRVTGGLELAETDTYITEVGDPERIR